MEEQAGSEKRKFTRVSVATLVVIRCDVWANISNKEKHEFHTHTENVSEGGLNVILDEELHSPDAVELKLFVTGKVTPIECKGQVAWTKLISPVQVKPALFSTGIQFTELSHDSKEAIRNVVSCFSDKEVETK